MAGNMEESFAATDSRRKVRLRIAKSRAAGGCEQGFDRLAYVIGKRIRDYRYFSQKTI